MDKPKRLNQNRIMVFSFCLLMTGLILSTLNCSQNKMLYRATSEYFPLKAGMVWYYVNSADPTDTSVVEVIGDSSAYGDFSTLIYRDFLEEYWIKDKTQIKKLFEIKINRAGFEFILEQDYLQYFRLPLITGNSWRDSLINAVDVQGDLVNLRHSIFGKVEEIEDISTPAGEFSEVYRVLLVDTLWIDDSLSVKTSFFWLAPGKGSVKQRFEAEDTIEQILVQFTEP